MSAHANISFKNCHFENITVSREIIRLDGYLHKRQSSLALFGHCTFTSNAVTNLLSIVSISRSYSIFNSCRFVNNSSGGNGSVAIFEAGSAFKNSYFVKNFALGGGAIYVSAISFKNSAPLDKYPNRQSAYKYLYSSSVSTVVSNCTFAENQAKYSGSAIFCNRMKLYVKTSVFRNNTASYRMNGRGAISSRFSPLFIVSNSSFVGNKAELAGAIYAHETSQLLVNTSFFRYNIASGNRAGGGAIHIEARSVFSVLSCSFTENKAFNGGAIYHVSGINGEIKKSNFVNNTAYNNGGAVNIMYAYFFIMSDCIFIRNRANVKGGAVDYNAPTSTRNPNAKTLDQARLFINASSFYHNTVQSKDGVGGALNLNHPYFWPVTVQISHCVFDGNQAPFRGGGIMADVIRKLTVRNSSFQSSPDCHNEGYFGGEFIYSVSEVSLKNAAFKDINTCDEHNSLIIHYNKPSMNFTILLNTEINIKCAPGKTLKRSGKAVHQPTLFKSLVVSCIACPQNLYNLMGGEMELSDFSNALKNRYSNCSHCPLGGICNAGKIRAANNFWGYKLETNVFFATCPFRYCCFGKECIDYSSCHPGRVGTLCGVCENGLTENVLTSDCLVPRNCNKRTWIWLLVIASGIIYLIILMYIDIIAKVIAVLLIPEPILKQIRFQDNFEVSQIVHQTLRYVKQMFTRNYRFQYLTNDVSITDNEETFGESSNQIEMLDNEEMQELIQENIPSRNENDKNFFLGLMKIVIFFYQVNTLFKVFNGSKANDIFHVLQEILSALFSLRADGGFAQGMF